MPYYVLANLEYLLRIYIVLETDNLKGIFSIEPKCWYSHPLYSYG